MSRISLTLALKDLASAGLISATNSIRSARTQIRGMQADAKASGSATSSFQKNLLNVGNQAKILATSLKGIGASTASGFISGSSAALNTLTAAFGRSRTAAASAATAFSQAGSSLTKVATLSATAGTALSSGLGSALAGVGGLVLNIGGLFTGALVGAVKFSASTITGVIKGIVNAVFSLKSAFISLAAFIGVRKIVQDLTEVEERLDKIGKIALRSGFNQAGGKQDFFGLTVIAEQLNIEVETLDSSFRVFSRNLGKASRDASLESKKAFDRIGIDYKQMAREVSDGSKTIFDAVLEVSDSFKTLKLSQAELDDVITVLFGETAPRLVAFLSQGKTKILELVKAAKDAGLTVEDAVFERAFRLVESFKVFRDLLFSTKAVLIDAFSEPIKEALDVLTKIVLTIRLARNDIKQFLSDGFSGWRAYRSLIKQATANFSDLIDIQKEYKINEERLGAVFIKFVKDRVAYDSRALASTEGFMQVLKEKLALLESGTTEAERAEAAALRAAIASGLALDNTQLKALQAFSRLQFLGKAILNFFKDVAFSIGKFFFTIILSVIKTLGPEIAKIIGSAIIDGLIEVRKALDRIEDGGIMVDLLRKVIAPLSKIQKPALREASDLLLETVSTAGDAATKAGQELSKAYSDVKENVLSVIPGLQAAADAADANTDRVKELIAQLSRMREEFNETPEALKRFDLQAKISFLEVISQMASFEDAGKRVGDTIGKALTSGITSTLRSIILEAQDAAEAFRMFAANFLADLAEIITQLVIANFLKDAFFKPGSSGANVGLFGGFAAALGFNEGGEVPGPRHIKHDVIPAVVAPGEFIQNRDAVDYYGVGFMEAIRRKAFPRHLAAGFSGLSPLAPSSYRFNSGGFVAAPSSGSAPAPGSVVLPLDGKFAERLLSSSAGPVLERWVQDLIGKSR